LKFGFDGANVLFYLLHLELGGLCVEQTLLLKGHQVLFLLNFFVGKLVLLDVDVHDGLVPVRLTPLVRLSLHQTHFPFDVVMDGCRWHGEVALFNAITQILLPLVFLFGCIVVPLSARRQFLLELG
jgi:hypothetical protein